MAYALGKQSLSRLEGVHPDLVKVVKRAIQISDQDFMVLEGVRTPARQKELYAQGRTKPGPKVTWTLKSNHFKQADGCGHAVDLVPYPVDWNTASKFTAIAKAMLVAADDLGVKLRWGGNWDGDDRPGEKGETDGPHFELAK